ncbi:MAG: MFS transporter [Actinomycetota bacterium]|nr:MFS transporter [Actinomycetota bacterium]
MTGRTVKRIFWILTFTLWLPVGFLLPVLILTMVERGLGLAEIGLVFTVYGLTTVLLELPTGGIADSFGRRPVLIVAAILQAAMAFIWFASDSFALFAAAAMVGGISRALSSGPLEAWYVDATHEIEPDAPIRSGLAGGEVTGALGLALGSFAVAAITLVPGIAPDGAVVSTVRLPSLLAAATAGLNAVAIAALIRERRPAASSVRAAFAEVPVVMRRAFDISRRPGAIRLLLGAGVLMGVAFAAVELFYQPLFRGMVDSTASATRLFGVLAFGLSLASAAGAGLASRVPEGGRVHPGQVGAVSLLLVAGGIVGLSLSSTVLLGVTFFIGIYAVGGFAHPFSQLILHAGVGASERATMLSGWSLSFQVGVLITGLGLAQVADRAGIPSALWIAAGAMVAASFLYLAIDRIRVKASPQHDRSVSG